MRTSIILVLAAALVAIACGSESYQVKGSPADSAKHAPADSAKHKAPADSAKHHNRKER